MSTFTKLAISGLPDLNVFYKKGTYSYKNTEVIKENIEILQKIRDKFYPSIKKWGDCFEIDTTTIIGFIAVESSGKENLGPNAAKATGLCQVTPISVIETISKFKVVTKKDLPAEARDSINKKAPYLLKLTADNQNLSTENTTKLLSLLQHDNDFNILMGTIALRWLFELLKFDNKVWFNRVIIGYNQSAYGRIKFYKGKPLDTDKLYRDKVIPKETRDYLAKLLGINGFMQLIIDNKIY